MHDFRTDPNLARLTPVTQQRPRRGERRLRDSADDGDEFSATRSPSSVVVNHTISPRFGSRPRLFHSVSIRAAISTGDPGQAINPLPLASGNPAWIRPLSNNRLTTSRALRRTNSSDASPTADRISCKIDQSPTWSSWHSRRTCDSSSSVVDKVFWPLELHLLYLDFGTVNVDRRRSTLGSRAQTNPSAVRQLDQLAWITSILDDLSALCKLVEEFICVVGTTLQNAYRATGASFSYELAPRLKEV